MWLVSLPSLIKPSRSPVLAAAWIFIMPHSCGAGGIKLSVLISPMAPSGSWLVKKQSLGTATLPASSGKSWQILWLGSSLSEEVFLFPANREGLFYPGIARGGCTLCDLPLNGWK